MIKRIIVVVAIIGGTALLLRRIRRSRSPYSSGAGRTLSYSAALPLLGGRRPCVTGLVLLSLLCYKHKTARRAQLSCGRHRNLPFAQSRERP